MSSDHHTPVAVGASGDAATINAPLGQLDAAITVVGAPIVQSIVAHTVISDSIATVDLEEIPDDYSRLRLVLTLRSDVVAIQDDIDITFNADTTGANYYTISQCRYNNAGSIASTFDENLGATGAFRVEKGAAGASSPADWIGALIVEILQYADATDFKTFIASGFVAADTNAGELFIIDGGGIWLENANKIDQITVTPVAGGNWTAGSYALEGII